MGRDKHRPKAALSAAGAWLALTAPLTGLCVRPALAGWGPAEQQEPGPKPAAALVPPGAVWGFGQARAGCLSCSCWMAMLKGASLRGVFCGPGKGRWLPVGALPSGCYCVLCLLVPQVSRWFSGCKICPCSRRSCAEAMGCQTPTALCLCVL